MRRGVRGGSARSGGASGLIPIQPVRQKTGSWCWAACAEMILRFYGIEVDQCRIATDWLPRQSQPVPGSCCDEEVMMRSCVHAFADVDRRTPDLYATWDVTVCSIPKSAPKDVCREVRAGRPVLLAYGRAEWSHLVVALQCLPRSLVTLVDPQEEPPTRTLHVDRIWPSRARRKIASWVAVGRSAEEC